MVMLFDQDHLPEDVYMIVFATDQQALVGKMLVDEIKSKGVSLGKTEMSVFATLLHDGTKVNITTKDAIGRLLIKQEAISYNKRQFYDRILTPMKGMGLIDYNIYTKKYSLSDRFGKVLTRITLMWSKELDRKR